MPSERKGIMNSNKEVAHLSSEERRIIETGIRHGSTKTAIAKTIGKDNYTVGKEIFHLISLLYQSYFSGFLISNDSPVISSGFSMPIISSSVGATSARQPPSLRV